VVVAAAAADDDDVLQLIGVTRIVAAGMHSIVASNGDDRFLVVIVLTIQPPLNYTAAPFAVQ